MKRRLAILLAALLLLVPAMARAEFDYNSIPTPNIIVVDGNDVNTVFYERAADERAYPASTTKIMTCLLALESGKLNDSVTVGQEVTGTPELQFTSASSLMGLKPGDTVTLRDLINGLMIVSGNDAAAAIAIHVAGSIPSFVDQMNAKAASIGMNSTHFMNPHGVQNENHYTTARDMAKLMAHALQNPEFCEVDKTISYTIPSTGAVHMTTNRLLRNVEGDPVETYYEYAIGGKTGDTNAAGKCFVAVAEKDGARVIVVLFGDRQEMYDNDAVYNNIARFVNAKNIFEHVFATQFTPVTAQSLAVPTSFDVDVAGVDPAEPNGGKLALNADLTGVQRLLSAAQAANLKANAAAITTSLELTQEPVAPISAGQAMGLVSYYFQGEKLFSAPLTAAGTVSADPNAPSAAAPTGDAPDAMPSEATATPLLDKGHRKLTASSAILLVLILLIVLLAALIVVFIITERTRRYERRRRAARRKKRQY